MQDMYLKDGRSFLYVGDVGRKLVINIPNLNIIRVCYETKEGFTKDVDVEHSGDVFYADIPNTFLSGAYSALTCYAIATDGEYAYTASEAHFEIKDRQKSEGYSPTDQQLITWDYIETKALEYMNQTEVYMGQAGASADNAEGSAASALQSKNASAQSEANAKLSETNAKASETTANQSETNARASEVAAKQSEDNAQASADNAESSAASALQSKNASAQSEANAKLSETNAKASETAAEQTLAEAQQIVAGKADKTYVDSNLATKADKSELAVERARIDSLSTLPEGSTTGDAELIGIRIGADGVTYPNAGEAVRTQILNEKTSRETAVNELKGDLDTERNARVEADTDHSTRIQKNRYEIDNLKAKAEGKLYRTETVEAEAYALDVPSSVAPYAEVQRICGKSVVWNQLISPKTESVTMKGITYTWNGVNITMKGTTEGNVNSYYLIQSVEVVAGHKYLIGKSKKYTPQLSEYTAVCLQKTEYLWCRFNYQTLDIVSPKESGLYNFFVYFVNSEGVTVDEVITPQIIDLTQMFGSGKEPTREECNKIFSADYYPFDAGTIKSFPVRTVRSVNAEGTEIGSMDVSSVTSDLNSAGSVHDEWNNGKKIKRVGERTYTSGDESDSSLITDGTTTYYPLDTSTEETVPEIDNYIKVEGGGTLKFESDDTVHMPISSTDRFVVDLTSTMEETT